MQITMLLELCIVSLSLLHFLPVLSSAVIIQDPDQLTLQVVRNTFLFFTLVYISVLSLMLLFLTDSMSESLVFPEA